MTVNVRDHTIIKVVQATHHQGDIRYDTSRGYKMLMHAPCLIKLGLFKSIGLWNQCDLDSILDKGDQLFKSTSKSRYLGVEELPQKS